MSTSLHSIDRREFLKISTLSTAGFVFGFYFNTAGKLIARSADRLFEPNVWITTDKDGITTITMHRSEMGQKVWTSLPMVVAEELEADWTKVRVVQGDLNSAYGRQVTGGSASVRTSYDKLRMGGAVAREMLITAAAMIWNVPRTECYARNGEVIHTGTGRSLGFGDLAEKAGTVPIPGEVPLKDPRDFKIIGKSIKSLNDSAKVDGSLVYGYDLQLPGMLTAVIARCSVIGGKVKSYDASEALKIPGVRKIFPISAGISVVGENTSSVLRSRNLLKIDWDEGENAVLDSDTITERFKDALNNESTVVIQEGDVESALSDAETSLEAVYEAQYLDHATMEPMNCSAQVQDGKCEIWAPTQDPAAAFESAKQITGFSQENITVHTLTIGCGLGRRFGVDFIEDAVETAMELDVPVKVVRTREEDISHGIYRPATINQVKAGLDEHGKPVAWVNRISGPFGPRAWIITGGSDALPYTIPNIHINYVMSDINIPIGPLRSVANIQNAFVNECFIDELAHKSGNDPFEYRRSLMTENKRQQQVLELAAEKAEWKGSSHGGKYYGIASHYCFRSYAATVAEISLDDGKLKIHRMICAIDCGIVINPDGIRAQMEGGIALGITAALYGAITFEQGKVQQSNFHDYRLLRMKQMPVVETHIVSSSESPTGAGEPPVPPTAPALVNAIFAATGIRNRKLPLSTYMPGIL